MRTRGVLLLGPIVCLATACLSIDEEVRRFTELMAGVVNSARALRDTADGCAIDLAFTNPYAQPLRVMLTYRAFDPDGRKLPGFRVGGVAPANQHVVLAGESTPGIACATVARLEPLRLELRGEE
jgi:hypothetical protein